MKPRRVIRTAAVLALGAAALAGHTTASDATTNPNVMQASNCRAGAFFFLSANPATVRSIGQIPARWKLAVYAGETARLYLDTVECEQTLNGRSRPVTWTQVSAVLDSAHIPSPERTRSTSNVEGKPNDLYLIAWDANDADFVHWLQQGTGLADVARYVPGLTFQMSTGLIRQYRFNAPRPAQSTFRITASYLPNLIPVFPVESNLWRQTSAGSVLFDQAHTVPGLFGFFQQWTFTTPATSAIARMIGSSHQSRTCTLAMLPAPLLAQGAQDPGCLSATEHDGAWTETKSL